MATTQRKLEIEMASDDEDGDDGWTASVVRSRGGYTSIQLEVECTDGDPDQVKHLLMTAANEALQVLDSTSL